MYHMACPTFFSPGSELADLEDHIRRLQSSAHAPPVDRAEHILVNIQRTMLRKHEAKLQVRIATTVGYDEHRQLWQETLDLLDQRIAESTTLLRGHVVELRVRRFQIFAAASVIGIVALRRLFNPPADGRPPLISQRYLAESAFVHGSTEPNF